MTQPDISITLLHNNRLTLRKCHYREQPKSGRTIEGKEGDEKIEDPLKQGALSLPVQFRFSRELCKRWAAKDHHSCRDLSFPCETNTES